MKSMPPITPMNRLIYLLFVVLLTACRSAPTGPSGVTRITGITGATGVTRAENIERIPGEHALLLLLEDQKTYDAYTVDRAFGGDTALRIRLAMTLGRLADPQGCDTLEELLVDPEVEVRRAAAFSLGLLMDSKCIEGLLFVLDKADRETAALAVEALARLEIGFKAIELATDGLASNEALYRLLPTLFRFSPDDIIETAEAGLQSEVAILRRQAAYAIARNPVVSGLEILRPLTEDPSPRVRAWAARALGRVGDKSDLVRLWSLVNGEASAPLIQAMRAGKSLIDRGEASAPLNWVPRIVELVNDSRPGIRQTTLQSAAGWLPDENLAEVLIQTAQSGSGSERRLAIVALVAGGVERGADLVAGAIVDADPELRLAAVDAATILRDLDLLKQFRNDESAQVRVQATAGLLEALDRVDIDQSMAQRAVTKALADRDSAVRATALDWLVERPIAPMEELLSAMQLANSRRSVEHQLSGVKALAARARIQPLERGAIVKAIEEMSESGDYVLRRESAHELEALGRPRPLIGSVRSKSSASTYQEILNRTDRLRYVEVVTKYGSLKLQIDCPRAPRTCLNFLQLVDQGYYDGLVFHRVVPDFVVQAGDSRGDGWGGPGYVIRDEINRLRYERGVLGMALSGPDTGGSQFFVTLAAQPHLDGAYTAFGKVVGDDAVLDLIRQGDRIQEMVLVEGSNAVH